MLDRVLQAIRERHRFVVTSHARPDGDGIGSALACGEILRVMGKDAEVVMYDGVPRIYQGLPFADRPTMPSSCWNATAYGVPRSLAWTSAFSSTSITTSADAISRTSIGLIPR